MTREDLAGLGYAVMAPSPETDPIRWTMSPPAVRGRVEFAASEDEAWALAVAWHARVS